MRAFESIVVLTMKFLSLKVVLCVVGVVIVVTFRAFLSLLGVEPQPVAEIVPLRFWEPPAPLAGDWPVATTCNVSYVDKEHGQILARGFTVLRAATLLGARYLEISNSSQAEALIPALSALEGPLHELRVVLGGAKEELRCLQGAGSEDRDLHHLLAELPSALGTAHSNLLPAILSARRATATSSVERALEDDRDRIRSTDVAQEEATDEAIKRLEALAIREIEEDDAGAHFDIGMYWSKASVISQSVGNIVKAEELLLQGEQASINLGTLADRALARAARIHEHANLLAAKMDFDSGAAESRYRAAAKIALRYQSPDLAARSLSRLAHFLADLGRNEEALRTAGEALRLDEGEPVAQYVQVSLRQSMAKLRNTVDIRIAEAHLSGLAGRLGAWPELEASRAVLHANFEVWRGAAEEGSQSVGVGLYEHVQGVWRACLRHQDAALSLLCLLCKAALPA